MPKGKQIRDRTFTLSAGHELENDETTFLQMASMGNLAKVKEIMELSEDPKKYMQLTDFKDRTALEIATEVEHFEIVDYLVHNFGELMDTMHVHESLMLAISKGYLRITQVLLDHPLNRTRNGSDRKSSYYATKCNSKFDRDVTPLMLASQCNEVDIIRLLLSRGEFIEDPHPILCDCKDCVNTKDQDPLMHSLAVVHTYRALTSEAYISLTSSDPILTAFLLSEELTKLATLEKEFKNGYHDLVKQCKQYASDLLDMCQNTDEVRTILTQEATTKREVELEEVTTLRRRNKQIPIEESKDEFALPRLELAIKYRQKQFVAHPHCQHHLAILWYKGTPSTSRRWHIIIKLFMTIGMIVALPVLALVYWFYPKGAIADFMRSPRTKFMMHSSMYVLFLTILFLESVVAQEFINSTSDQKYIENRKNCIQLYDLLGNQTVNTGTSKLRSDQFSGLQWVIIVFVSGMLWSEVKQIFREGYKHYLRSFWNWIDIAMLNLLISSLLIRVAVYEHVKDAKQYFATDSYNACMQLGNDEEKPLSFLYWLRADREYWNYSDPILVSEALFALANVLSFSRLSFILPVNEFLGPLQISLGRMLGQILRFGAVFIVVFLAFFCALSNLYWYYPDTANFGRFDSALETLFWALFGLGEKSDVGCPDEFPKCGHPTTEFFGTILYIIYHVVMALVMLNMLIAMMTTSFQEINDDEDVEWKFARAQLWMSYFERGATLPVPLNIMPSPKSVYYLCRWLKHKICPTCNRFTDSTTELPIGMQNLNRRAGVRKQVSSHESLMKTVVKRYLFKLQNDKEGDEVDEGELEEIKNDISSFRFELMEKIRCLSPDAMSNGGYSSPAFINEHVYQSQKSHTKPRDIQFRMATIENKLDTLTETFATFYDQAKDALQPGKNRGKNTEFCTTQ